MMDSNDVEPSLSAEIVAVVCGLTSREQGFGELCAVEFWDVSGCGMYQNGSRVMVAAAGWRRRWPKGQRWGEGCCETKVMYLG